MDEKQEPEGILPDSEVLGLTEETPENDGADSHSGGWHRGLRGRLGGL